MEPCGAARPVTACGSSAGAATVQAVPCGTGSQTRRDGAREKVTSVRLYNNNNYAGVGISNLV